MDLLNRNLIKWYLNPVHRTDGSSLDISPDILSISLHPTNRRRSDPKGSATWLPLKCRGYLIHPLWYLKSKDHYATRLEKISIDVGVPSIRNLPWVVQYSSAINTYTSIRISLDSWFIETNHWNLIFQYTTCTGLSGLLTDQESKPWPGII